MLMLPGAAAAAASCKQLSNAAALNWWPSSSLWLLIQAVIVGSSCCTASTESPESSAWPLTEAFARTKADELGSTTALPPVRCGCLNAAMLDATRMRPVSRSTVHLSDAYSSPIASGSRNGAGMATSTIIPAFRKSAAHKTQSRGWKFKEASARE